MVLIHAQACWCSYANYLANHEPSIVPRKVLNFPSIGINIVLKGDIKSLNPIVIQPIKMVNLIHIVYVTV